MSDIKEKLMKRIDSGEVKMRSRNFFVFAKAALEVGVISLLILVIYLFNLSIYIPKKGLGGSVMMSSRRFEVLMGAIPWHYLLLGVIVLGLSFWLVYQYTGMYKRHLTATLMIVSIIILVTSFGLAISGFNEHFENQRQFRGMYQQYGGSNPFRGPGSMRENNQNLK